MITAEELRTIVRYEPGTGDFLWLQGYGRRKAGELAPKRPYVRFKFNGKMYLAHRLAWLYVYGEWPKEFLDHINGDPSDNRISNLREATPLQNCANRRIHRDNKSGLKGVCQIESGKFMASIQEAGKQRYLGVFDSAKAAHQRYFEEAIRIHGEYARAG